MSLWFLQLVRLRIFVTQGSRAPRGHDGGASGCPEVPHSACEVLCVCMFSRRVESIAYIGFSTEKVKNLCPAVAEWILILWLMTYSSNQQAVHSLERKVSHLKGTASSPHPYPLNESLSYCVKEAEPGSVSNLKLINLSFCKTLGVTWDFNFSHR